MEAVGAASQEFPEPTEKGNRHPWDDLQKGKWQSPYPHVFEIFPAVGRHAGNARRPG